MMLNFKKKRLIYFKAYKAFNFFVSKKSYIFRSVKIILLKDYISKLVKHLNN